MNGRPLRIGELAAASGLTRDALRYYERQGLLPRSRRTSGGFREDDGGAVDRIRFIKQAQAHGLTLREIRDLVTLWLVTIVVVGLLTVNWWASWLIYWTL